MGRGNLAHLLANEAPAYQDRLVQRHQAGSQFVQRTSGSPSGALCTASAMTGTSVWWTSESHSDTH